MTPDENEKKPQKNEDSSTDVLKKLQSVRKKLQESLSEGSEKVAKAAPGEISLVPGAAEAMRKAEQEKRAAEQKEKIAELDKAAAGPSKKKRALYKKGATPDTVEGVHAGFPTMTAPKKVKERKVQRVSQRRMAMIQRRVQEKVKKTQRVSKGRRVAMALTIVVCIAAPMLLTNTLATLTMNFDIDEIALEYQGKPGELLIYLPAHNPGILPAYLGRVELEIWDNDPITGEPYMVGGASTDAPLWVAPLQTVQLTLRLTLIKGAASNWMSNLLNTLSLQLSIREFHYNGIKLADNLIPALPPIDIQSLILDLVGLDMTELITDLFPSGDGEAQIAAAYSRALGLKPDPTVRRDLWLEYLAAVQVMDARDKYLLDLVGQKPDIMNPVGNDLKEILKFALKNSIEETGLGFPSAAAKSAKTNLPEAAQFDDLLGGLELKRVDIKDLPDAFQVEVVIGMPLPDAGELIGFNIGDVIITNMTASLYLTTNVERYNEAAELMEEDPDEFETRSPEKWLEIYDHPFITLEGIESDYVGEAHKELMGDVLTEAEYPNMSRPDAIAVQFGGMAKVGLRLKILKDDIGNADIHPSQQVDWDDPLASEEFIQLAKAQYPAWFFLYDLLMNGALNVYLQLTDLDLTIFGIPIENTAIRFLPPIAGTGLFDLSDLGSNIGFGMFDAVQLLVLNGGTGGVMLPFMLDEVLPGPSILGEDKKKHKDPKTGQLDYDRDLMEQIEEMLILDLDMDEILGSLVETFDDQAKLGIALTIGLNNTLFDLWVGLKDTWIGLSNEIDGVERVFAKMEISQEGSKEFFMEGILEPGDEPYPLTITLEIYKNETMAPHTALFLRELIENFNLDATFNLHVGRLLLFKEKYTWPEIDISLGFELSLWSMLEDAIVGLIEDLFAGDDAAPETEGAGLLANPLFAPFSMVTGLAFRNPLSAFLGVPSAAQDTGEEEGASDPISALLEDLLGIEMGNLGIAIGVNNLPATTELTLDVTGLEIPADTLPIHIGMGYADIDILTKNKYGGWEPIINARISNYFEAPSEFPQSISVALEIYHGDTLCAFTEGLLQGGTLNISIDGTMDLNLTGIYIEDTHLSLTGERGLEDIELNLDIQSLVDDLISGLSGDAYGGLYPNEFPSWWTGDPEDFVRAAQLEGFEDYLELGDISLYELSEDEWPIITNDTDIHVQLGVGLINKLMHLEITELEAQLYARDESTLYPPVHITAPNPGSIVGGDSIQTLQELYGITTSVDDSGGRLLYQGGTPVAWYAHETAQFYKQQHLPLNGTNAIADGYQFGGFMRFVTNIPQGSVINDANLTITPMESVTLFGDNTFRVYGFAVDDIGDFRDATNMNMPTTAASTAIVLNQWLKDTPINISVTSIVDEIVNQEDFAGDHIAFVITRESYANPLDAGRMFQLYQFDSGETYPALAPHFGVNYDIPDPGTVVEWTAQHEYVDVEIYLNGTYVDEVTGSGEYKLEDGAFPLGDGWYEIKLIAYDGNGAYMGEDSIWVDFESGEDPVAGTPRPALTAQRNLLGEISLEEGSGIFYTGIPSELIINIDLNKSSALENWLNTLIATLEVTGSIDATIGLKVFNCQIGPLYIKDLDLGALGLSAESLLDAVNPLSDKFGKAEDVLSMTPNAAQADLMEAIGKFGLSWLIIQQTETPDLSKPIDLETPMIDVTVGLALEPTLNLTIESDGLQLLDKTIFNAVYNKDPEEPRDWDLWNQAVTLSRIAEVSFRPGTIHMNNTLSYPGDPTNYAVDVTEAIDTMQDPAVEYEWGKPYFYNYTSEDYEDGYSQLDTFITTRKNYYPELRGPNGQGVYFNDVDQYGFRLFQPLYNSTHRDVDGDLAYVGGTFTFFEIQLRLYNMSHPNFQYAYPRTLWRQMGAPFFPVQTFGPEQGGFPEERVEYHPYFSPFSNLFGGIGNALEDPASILANVAFNGSLRLNIFSMDLTLDVGAPVISDLLGSLTEMLGEGLAKTIEEGSNPGKLMGLQPAQSSLTQTGMLQQVKPGVFVPRSAQFDDLLGGGVDIGDIYALRDAAVVSDRPSHGYFADYGGNAFGGTNTNPWRENPYTYDGQLGMGYNDEWFIKDLYFEDYKIVVDNWADSMDEENPFFETKNPWTGEEYENPDLWPLKWKGNPSFGHRLRTFMVYFVLGVDLPLTLTINSAFVPVYAWHSSKPCAYAPMGYAFINESRTLPQGAFGDAYGGPGVASEYHWMGSADDVSTSWREGKEPLIFYQTDRQRKELIANQANPSTELNMFADDPYTWVHTPTGHRYFNPNERIDDMNAEIGNGDIEIPAWTRTPNWELGTYEDRYTNGSRPYWTDTYEPTSTGGHVYQPSNWIDLNLRFFECQQSWEFFWELISNGLTLVVPLLAAQANVTVFGYHIYDLAASLPLEDNMVHFEGFCDMYEKSQGGGGSVYGVPSANGSIDVIEEEAVKWPPSLPGFDYKNEKPEIFDYILGEDFLEIIDLDAVLDAVMDNLVNIIIENLIGLVTGGIIHATVPITLYNPIPLPVWLWKLELGAELTNNVTAAEAAGEGGEEWDLILDHAYEWLSWTSGALRVFSSDINVEFQTYPDQDKFNPDNEWPWNVQTPGAFMNGEPNGDFLVDPLEVISLREEGAAMTINLTIQVSLDAVYDLLGVSGILDALIKLITGELELDLSGLMLWINTFDIFAALPAEWGWSYRLLIPDIADPMALGDLGSLL